MIDATKNIILNQPKLDSDSIIALDNIGQSYDGGKHWIIKDLNIDIKDKPKKGQFIVILGMSGCGKSTLLRYMAGLQKPTEGNVYINGSPVSKQSRVSMVFQQYSSLPWMSVLDNVSLALRYKGIAKSERDNIAMDMIRKIGLEGHEQKYAQYPTLSGGQLQRVAIARSMIANPKILLMDEPFGALDIRTRLRMQDLLSSLWRSYESTIVFVTHDINEAVYLADDIYIMKAAPSQFVKHIPINLPLVRDRSIKRSPEYIKLVHEVEDQMILVSEM